MDMTKLKFTGEGFSEGFSSGGSRVKPYPNDTITCRCTKASELLLTGCEQIAVVIKHLQGKAAFPGQEQEGVGLSAASLESLCTAREPVGRVTLFADTILKREIRPSFKFSST